MNIQIGSVSFPIDPELDAGMMSAIQFGDYGLEVALLLEEFLQPGMTFVDVGANVGYFSAIALDRVRLTGSVHSFEPVPDLFRRLEAFAYANPQYRLACNMCALGSKAETRTLAVAGVTNAGWNTLVPNFMEASGQVENILVDVQRLDEYLALLSISAVDLIKIDVEGYEFPVLRGAEGFLATTYKKPPIICEIAPEAYSRLETSLEEFCNYMARLHYRAHDLLSRAPLNLPSLTYTTDVLFLAES
jgi:FkbM family methyltransferase